MASWSQPKPAASTERARWTRCGARLAEALIGSVRASCLSGLAGWCDLAALLAGADAVRLLSMVHLTVFRTMLSRRKEMVFEVLIGKGKTAWFLSYRSGKEGTGKKEENEDWVEMSDGEERKRR